MAVRYHPIHPTFMLSLTYFVAFSTFLLCVPLTRDPSAPGCRLLLVLCCRLRWLQTTTGHGPAWTRRLVECDSIFHFARLVFASHATTFTQVRLVRLGRISSYGNQDCLLYKTSLLSSDCFYAHVNPDNNKVSLGYNRTGLAFIAQKQVLKQVSQDMTQRSSRSSTHAFMCTLIPILGYTCALWHGGSSP